MLATNDLRAILDAAEQAVAREDFTSAERLLREALALQESTPGSQRDEVAKTLNNLAIVCEMTGKLGDAETGYRRAYRIATATLPATDPFVTTSRENLEEFCKAQGLPLDLAPVVAAAAPRPPAVSKPAPAPPPPESPVLPRAASPAPPRAASPAPPRAASPAPPGAASPAPARAESPAPSRTASAAPARATSPAPSRPTSPAPPPFRVSSPVSSTGGWYWPGFIIGVLSLAAIAVVIVLARGWLAPDAAPNPAASTSPSEPAASAPPPAPVPAPEPAREPEPVAATPSPVAATPEPAATVPEPPATTASPGLTVVTAQVCRSLSTTGAWQCTPASDAQGPGPMIFYTRVASPRDTTIEHRWYRNDQLHQRVQLRIRANASGFRTYSRTTVTPDRAGNWKVELRAADGRVLDEETFSVR